ncbi:hypothetical protein AB0J63_48245 [Streptosporangium canum]
MTEDDEAAFDELLAARSTALLRTARYGSRDPVRAVPACRPWHR